jgi:hypothetical protein
MKGIIFNLVGEVVVGAYGEDAWDDILDAAGLDGSYTSLGSYPDDDLFRLVGAASTQLETEPRVVVRMLGEGAIPLLAQRYPGFFEHTTTRDFLLTLNDIIHPEVRKLYPGADVPEFEFQTSGDGDLVLGYQSPRKLCALAEGFIRGAATHFGEQVAIEQPQCMHDGAESCLLACRFSPAA